MKISSLAHDRDWFASRKPCITVAILQEATIRMLRERDDRSRGSRWAMTS